ncbi:MAG: DNA-binding response regulator, OmpR family, contains REC and winged-helix (wHTH) domain [Chloroflexi bacterium AL-W]|nr:DNA-binding response regulator, OmpR family, contains REC and winged-helix (wHTH) domain [Chloroflexi bacterium AL-N1]NOK70725.1 DNA-binding response regulator, OmpR family, contains REC and winged-helix (wHTH) domain [Chloroflexi bacterium AL-N10]NOK78285.1 DNA-binding response regulator, OmpR family, contains REC and winged-helix (wHTH) domain [Chloroflexi bacterium AL-N5]NOK85628.1 DNA-binding response regulator, OmpR family, contains REC and winged-helix (wHTH) domain [Chloroflexi bacteri
MTGSDTTTDISTLHKNVSLHATIGIDGSFTNVDIGWSTILGWQRMDLLAKPFIERVHPDDLDIVITQLYALHSNGKEVTFYCRYRQRNGTYMRFNWHAYLHTNLLDIRLMGQPALS